MTFSETMIKNMSWDELRRHSHYIDASPEFLIALFVERLRSLESRIEEANDSADYAENVQAELEDAENELENAGKTIGRLKNQILGMAAELVELNESIIVKDKVTLGLFNKLQSLEETLNTYEVSSALLNNALIKSEIEVERLRILV